MICQRCTKQLPDSPDGASVHTCTPSPLVRELEQQRDELVEALQLISNGSTPAKFIAGLALAKVKK